MSSRVPALPACVVGLLVGAVLLAAAGCDRATEPAGTPAASGPSASSAASAATDPTPGADPTARAVVDPACLPGPGRTVRRLPPVTIPPLEVPAVTTPSGSELLAGITVPSHTVDTGCVIRYDAPGGCLGAVRITGATIPAAVIPSSALAATTLSDGGTVAAKTFAEVTTPAVTRPGAFAPQVCQARRDGRLLTVSRRGIVREGFSRPGLARPGGVRPQRCDGDDCVPEVRVDTVRLPPVELPDVDVDPERLASRPLPGHAGLDVLTGRGTTAYVAPARVLFTTDQAVIRPAAGTALAAIAARIRATAPGRRLVVDGHTDDRGTAAHGLVLSRRRAEAVADWLVAHGFRRSLIRTRGFGESAPAVPNTSAANRQRNRRVVITVLGPTR